MEDVGAPAARAVVVDRDVAFDELYQREYEPMVRVAVLLLGGQDRAEEVVHDAFARVYERWDKVDNHGGYLRTAVVNRCRDVQRRWLVERRTAASRQPDATDAGEVALGANELVDALASIPSKRRAALVLRFYADLTEADIATTLDVAPGTVKSLISRGLADLRKVVER